MDVVMIALSTDSIKCLPILIQDKIAIEILLNQFEDARKQRRIMMEAHTQMLARQNTVAYQIRLVTEQSNDLSGVMQMDPNFNVDERRSVLSRFETKLNIMRTQYEGNFRDIDLFRMERVRLNRRVADLSQELTRLATDLGEVDFVKEKMEKILIRELSEGL